MTLRVLLVDDQPIIAAAVQQMLEGAPGIQLFTQLDPASALATACAVDPAVILLDIQMEPLDGLAVLDQLRAEPALADVSVVMLSSAEDPEVKVDAFRRGANDYVVKLPSALELVARLRYHARACLAAREREQAIRSLLQSQVELAARHAEVEALNRELAESAFTDPLTGLRNRRFLRRLFGRQQAPLDRDSPMAQAGKVGLFLFDLDHFKRVNDTYGHDAGDAVLVETARRMKAGMPEALGLFRWGGEEMMVLLPIAHDLDIVGEAKRLLGIIGAAPVQLPGGEMLPVRCSLGFAPYPFGRDAAAADFDRVLALVDAAVYLAKHEGRNRGVGCLPVGDGLAELHASPRDPVELIGISDRLLSLRRIDGVPLPPT